MDINVKGKTYKISWEYLVIPCLILLLIIVLIISNFSSIRRIWVSYSEEITAQDSEAAKDISPSALSEPPVNNKQNKEPSQETRNNTKSQSTQEPVQQEKININTASKDDLLSLPYIGDVKAQAIIDYRTANGPFATVDDLVNVKGIGPKTLEKLRPFITV
ncbi:MAG: helix-hairpin-helix domain-containing protein [Clostridiaceae bacterium]|jgi:comEA protein|nr:helix-hairpin-helix domain-containing protein [Clostridiaceae bacterium]